jgi:hypothetical protein
MSLHPYTLACAQAISTSFIESTRAEAGLHGHEWWEALCDCLVDGLGEHVPVSPFDAAKFVVDELGHLPPPGERLSEFVGRWLARRIGVLGAAPASVDDARRLAGLRDVAIDLAMLCEAIVAGHGADAQVPRHLRGHLATLCQLGGALETALVRARQARDRLRLVPGARTDGAS